MAMHFIGALVGSLIVVTVATGVSNFLHLHKTVQDVKYNFERTQMGDVK